MRNKGLKLLGDAEIVKDIWEEEEKKKKSHDEAESSEKIVEEEAVAQKEREEVVKEPATKRKKSIPRKTTRKRQKLEEDADKDELKRFLDIVPRERKRPYEIDSLSNNVSYSYNWKDSCVDRDLSMLKKFGLEESKPMKTPMSSDTKLTKDEEYESVDSTKYRGMIGTTHLGLWYPKGIGIETVVYADSDHAGDYVDRKSTSEVMKFESAQSSTTAKLPILKLGEYDIQYNDAKTMFAAIKTRFKGNESTNKTHKTLLKLQYENFSASSVKSLDSIFNMIQKIVSKLAILSVVISQEDLNSKFLSSLPPEWNTHVVVWMNKAEIKTLSINDLYNNFKIVEQKIRKYVGASSGAQNLAFMTAPSTSSTNDVNTVSPQVSTAIPNVNTASPQVSTASFSDNVVYAFMVKNPNGSNLLHQDLEKIHEDDLEAMDLKWQLSLLSIRAKRYYHRTGKKIFINANDTAGYDKSKVECFSYHKMGHFTKECRAPRNKEGQFKNQDNTRKQGKNEDTSLKAMLAIDGVGFDWSDMAEEQVQTNMA
ncbi:ribonuclease H-like domain-containing protein, partial [Tanacetum coccineum]